MSRVMEHAHTYARERTQAAHTFSLTHIYIPIYKHKKSPHLNYTSLVGVYCQYILHLIIQLYSYTLSVEPDGFSQST